MANAGQMTYGDERAWHRLQREKPAVYAIFEKDLEWTATERNYCKFPVLNHDRLNDKARKRAQRKGLLRQLICDLCLENTHQPAKAGILHFFHESRHLRCETIERHLYAHSGQLARDMDLRICLESKMRPILEEVQASLWTRLKDRPLYRESYHLDEYALLKTASLLTPTLFRECVPEIARQIRPFADRTSILYAIYLSLRAWGCDPNNITDDDLKYRDLYASKENSPEGAAQGEHLLWYGGLYGEPDAWRFLHGSRYEVKAMIAAQRNTIRRNIINMTHAKCFELWRNAAWAQADLCKTWLSIVTLDGGCKDLTLEQAEKMLDIVLFTRSMTNAARSKELDSPRIRWIVRMLERTLHDPPYDLRRSILSEKVRKALEIRLNERDKALRAA